jgi:hypothetical protein
MGALKRIPALGKDLLEDTPVPRGLWHHRGAPSWGDELWTVQRLYHASSASSTPHRPVLGQPSLASFILESRGLPGSGKCKILCYQETTDDNGDWRRRPHCGRIVLLPGRLIPPQRGATAPSRPPEQKLRQSRLACLASHALSSERHQGDGIFCIRITPQVSNVLVPPFAKGGKRGFPL